MNGRSSGPGDATSRPPYPGAVGSAAVFAVIVALAVGALFLKSDDVAHVPIVIGVSAFDSARVAPALESLAEFCREKGCGDIRWRYFPENGAASGCDFYLMTSLQLSDALARGRLRCALIAAGREGRRYSTGAVIVRPGVRELPPGSAPIIFSSPLSAAGFLSPCRALARAGHDVAALGDRVEFAGRAPNDVRVVYGVVFGAYAAGGISAERLRALEAAGTIRRGEVDVLCEGEPFPEIVLAADPSNESAGRKGFIRRFPVVFAATPRPLAETLSALGIAAFLEPRESDLDLIARLSAMVPAALERRGGASSAAP